MLEIPGYLIEQRLGQGASGVVLQARQSSTGHPVALRVLPASACQVALLDDARAVSECFHPHLAAVYQVGEAAGRQFVAMEYLSGGSLRRRLRGGMDTAQAVEIIRELAGALAYLHARGLFHRDIRPRNILFRADGTPVLSDVSTSPMPLGGPHRYLSPEQQLANTLDGRSDLYSLGLVFHEMLSGEPPSGSDAPDSRLGASLASLEPVLASLLAADPGDRYPSAEAFIHDLDRHADAILDQARVQLPATVPVALQSSADCLPTRPAPKRRSKTPGWLLPGLGVGAGLLGAAALSTHLLMGQYPGFSLNWFAGDAAPVLQAPPGGALAMVRPLPVSRLLSDSPATPVTPSTAITGPSPGGDHGGWSVSLLSETNGGAAPVLGNSLQPRLAAVGGRATVGEGAALDADQAMLGRLLDTATTQYRDLKLTTPPGDNAFETYQTVLRLDPDNAEARAGMEAIAGRYFSWAERAWRRGSYRDSLDRVERGLGVVPDHPQLLALRKQVRTHWQEALDRPLTASEARPRRVKVPGDPFNRKRVPVTVTAHPDLWNRTSR